MKVEIGGNIWKGARSICHLAILSICQLVNLSTSQKFLFIIEYCKTKQHTKGRSFYHKKQTFCNYKTKQANEKRHGSRNWRQHRDGCKIISSTWHLVHFTFLSKCHFTNLSFWQTAQSNFLKFENRTFWWEEQS